MPGFVNAFLLTGRQHAARNMACALWVRLRIWAAGVPKGFLHLYERHGGKGVQSLATFTKLRERERLLSRVAAKNDR
jgi:hypothetical protein